MRSNSRGTTDAQQGKAAIQKEVERLEKWSDRKLTKFNKTKAKLCTLEGRVSGNDTGWSMPAQGTALLKSRWGSWCAVNRA